MELSIVMIVKNGAKTINKTLNSLKEFNDVVVYDNGSNDGTQEIAKKFSNVNLIEGNFFGFGPTKNKASEYAIHDFILILDSDEVLDSELINSLKNTIFDEDTIYILNFHAYYKNIQVKYCGWNNQKIKRLYNKNTTKFNDNLVHENIIDTDLKIKELNGNVKHYSYDSISDFIIKVDRYSSLYVKENLNKKVTPIKAISSSIFAFFKTYIIRRGFLDGYIGLVISFSRASVVFYKYIKLYENNIEKHD